MRFVLAELPILTLALWGLATVLTLFLLGQIVVSEQYRSHPLFTLYLIINLLQTAAGVIAYQKYGFVSPQTYWIVWTSQGIVAVARAVVVGEVCYQILAKFTGIWAMAVRILSLSAFGALILALYFGRRGYDVGIFALEIALEASMATLIAGLFLFVQYYRVPLTRSTGLLAFGLGLLSCSKILNDVVFERFLKITGSSWNYVSSAAFLGILAVWIWALRELVPATTPDPKITTSQVYANMMPSVNRQLAQLNEQLTQLWHLDRPKS
jgi:hypothetical protein